jgi:hypothetical protein
VATVQLIPRDAYRDGEGVAGLSDPQSAQQKPAAEERGVDEPQAADVPRWILEEDGPAALSLLLRIIPSPAAVGGEEPQQYVLEVAGSHS